MNKINMNDLISIIINLDSRPINNDMAGMFNGVVSRDFLVDGVLNKRKFFDGFNVEVIAYVDVHAELEPSMLAALREAADCVVLRKHNKNYRTHEPFGAFNDINYLHALSLAKGEYIAHFDSDMAAFARNKDVVSDYIRPVVDGDVKFVCYPSEASPKCVDDPSFGNHIWASTRFFFCRKDAIDITEMEAAIVEPETLYEKYECPPRILNWFEHFIGIASGYSVLNPPTSNDVLIFPWHNYAQGTMAKLNSANYDDIAWPLIACGAHSYHGGHANKLILP